MAIIPQSRKEDRSLAVRPGEQFTYFRHQINRAFDDFREEPWLPRGILALTRVG
jgi:hypothetical protein